MDESGVVRAAFGCRDQGAVTMEGTRTTGRPSKRHLREGGMGPSSPQVVALDQPCLSVDGLKHAFSAVLEDRSPSVDPVALIEVGEVPEEPFTPG